MTEVVSEIDDLIGKVLEGSERAWQRLLLRVGPQVEGIARHSRAMGSFRHEADEYRNVMARVFERLRRDEFRALRLYRSWQERNDSRGFDDWLTVVTTNVARDYVEERLGADRDQPRRRLVNTLAGVLDEDDESLAVGAHITSKLMAQEIMAMARAELLPQQLYVLEAWLQGAELDAAGQKTLRAALARLRRRLAESEDPA